MCAHSAARRLRLLIFSPYLEPHVGGLESFVSELNEVLLRNGHVERITVFTARLPADAQALEERGGRLRIVRYPAIELIPNFPLPSFWSPAFWRALRDAAPRAHDVLVSHTRFFVSSALALAVARITGRRHLHVEHGSDYVQLGSHFSRIAARCYDHLIGRFVLRRADDVVTVSQAAAAFVERLAHRPSHVIYRGIWPHRLSAVAPHGRILDQAGGRKVVTFVGRLIDGKGVSDLIRAFAQTGREDALLCVVGDGPRRDDLERLAGRLALADRTLFMGYLDEAEALGAILASDVVVNPSYTEGLPTTVLEAAFLGRAVLATDVGGTGEIVEDGSSGVLFAPRDTAELAAALERLLDDGELRRSLATAAQTNAKQRFDWELSAQRFVVVAVRDAD